MRPLNKYIIVKPIEEEVKSDFGMTFSAEDKKSSRYGTAKIVKVGTEVTSISDGDVVYYDKSGSHQAIIQGEAMTVILERDVVVVL
jgi:co-chaperonin GroES (HSP10)